MLWDGTKGSQTYLRGRIRALGQGHQGEKGYRLKEWALVVNQEEKWDRIQSNPTLCVEHPILYAPERRAQVSGMQPSHVGPSVRGRDRRVCKLHSRRGSVQPQTRNSVRVQETPIDSDSRIRKHFMEEHLFGLGLRTLMA